MAPTVDSFWKVLRNGESVITEVPASRWGAPAGGSIHGSGYGRGHVYERFGSFLDQIDQFDAGFFGISPREAAAMDPQQRLILELGWEALEDAQIIPARIAGSRTGVFIGAIWDDYATLLYRDNPEAIDQHTMTGLHRSIIANRLSYVLDFRGPSLTVDTGQSSSLMAVHMAAESLRSGESDLAIAGGVNLNILPESALSAERFGGLSPDGRCYTFDARANGYVRGEGAGIAVLKPLRAALADGDFIYCVIRGSAVGNDGASEGLTVPSATAQQDVLRQAYQRAGIDPADVQYVELHGTGTRVGDPIEAEALGRTLGATRRADSPLFVGSAKTNVGHLEAAAGIVGFLKAALAIKHAEIPASLNFKTPHPGIPMDEFHLRVPQITCDWPNPGRTLIAGVSSFGMGGTNCHVVLASPPDHAGKSPAAQPGPGPGVAPCAISARTGPALRVMARRVHQFITDHPRLSAADTGFLLAATRSTFEHRAVVLATQRDDLLDGLDALSSGRRSSGVIAGVASRPARIAFMFSGQGSQRTGMGRELYETVPTFAQALDQVCDHLDDHLEQPLREVMFGIGSVGRSSLLDQTAYTQPALFALEVALFHLVTSYGLRPDYLIGHSIGELAAAYVAGLLSLPDACALVARRGQLMQSIRSR
jgi:acyl transferase domain-containing protein